MNEILELEKLTLIKLDDLIKNLEQKRREGNEDNAPRMCD